MIYPLNSNLLTNTDPYCIQYVDYLRRAHLRPDDDQNCGRNMYYSFIGKT
jgi:hypothetical protein